MSGPSTRRTPIVAHTRTPAPTADGAPSRPRPRVPLLAVLLVALLAGLVAACSTVSELTALTGELDERGFGDVRVTIEPGETSALVVSADAPPGDSAAEGQDEVAEVVWTTFPRSFDALRVTVDGDATRWTYDELEADLGPRPEDLEVGGDVVEELERASLVTLAVLGGVGVVVVLVVGVVVLVLVRRSRRRTAARPPVVPWSPATPPPHPPLPSTAAPTTPVPPPGGWGTAPATPAPPAPTPTPGPAPHPYPHWTPPPARTKVDLRKRPEETRADRRRLGRRPRGPYPDPAHTPPGWD